MPPEEMSAHAVFTIRSPKGRPDDKSKMEPCEWEQLQALGKLNPDYAGYWSRHKHPMFEKNPKTFGYIYKAKMFFYDTQHLFKGIEPHR